jgi:DNA-binding transcriptional LysR family regulator
MEIDKIKHFRAVVETGHLRKAAGILGLSPGALSKSVKSLALEVGTELIRPSGRGIVVTDEGREVYHRSHRLISEYDGFLGGGRNAERRCETRVGTFEVFSSLFMAEFLNKEIAGERVQVLEFTPGKIEEAVVSQEIDYGITYAPFPSSALDHLKVGSFRMKVYARSPEKWRKIPVADWPFAVPTTRLGSNPLDLRSLDHWPELRLPRHPKYRFELLQTALETTSRGLSVIYCPEFVVKLFNKSRSADAKIKEVSVSQLEKTRQLRIFLVKRHSEIEGAFFKKLAKFIRMTSG